MFAYGTSALKFEGMSDAALNGQAVEHLYGVWSARGGLLRPGVGWVVVSTKTKISHRRRRAPPCPGS